jgi:hypothetical protein
MRPRPRPFPRTGTAILSIGFVLVTTACDPAAHDPNAYDPNAIFLDLIVDPEDPEVGQMTTFTISAHAVEKHLVSSSIDFDGDGVWDETRPNDDTTVGEQFLHAYAAAGSYTVRARVIDSSGTPAVRTRTVSVAEHVIRSVRAVAQVVYAGPYNGGQAAGACYAIGSPFTWPGETLPIEPGAGVSLSIGDFQRGEDVGVTQLFGQNRWAATPSGDFPYSCTFTITFHTTHLGQDVPFAPEVCGATSATDPYDPSRLQCTVDAKGEVP